MRVDAEIQQWASKARPSRARLSLKTKKTVTKAYLRERKPKCPSDRGLEIRVRQKPHGLSMPGSVQEKRGEIIWFFRSVFFDLHSRLSQLQVVEIISFIHVSEVCTGPVKYLWTALCIMMVSTGGKKRFSGLPILLSVLNVQLYPLLTIIFRPRSTSSWP